MEIITSKEVAELLHSDIRTIQKNAKKGFYPKGVCGQHGKYWLFNNFIIFLLRIYPMSMYFL